MPRTPCTMINGDHVPKGGSAGERLAAEREGKAYGKQSLPDALHGAWLERTKGTLKRRHIITGETLASLPLAVPFGTHTDLRGDGGRYKGRHRLKGIRAR